MLHTTAYKKKYSCKFDRYGYLHKGIFALALVMIIESTFTRKYAVTLAGNSSETDKFTKLHSFQRLKMHIHIFKKDITRVCTLRLRPKHH